ncbi:MAG: hypothetical protein ABI640_08790 [Gammaproteobacteria bacterium]
MSLALAQAGQRGPVVRLLAVGAVMVLAGLVVACQGSQSGGRTFYDFMEDGVARDGVLSRCDKAPNTTAADLECIAARRAASAVAIEQERARADGLGRQSERKLVALRDRSARQEQSDKPAPAPAVPAFGAPLGGVMPSMSDAGSDPYDVQFPGRPTFEVGEIAPPSSEVEIVPPTLEPEYVRPARLTATTN